MASSPTKRSAKSPKSIFRPQRLPRSKSPSSVSSHLPMIGLKSRILSSISKLSDRDTQQIAVEDLEKIIGSLPADGFPALLSALLHDPVPSPGDPSGARCSPLVARRESIRLLSLLCTVYPDAAAPHLPKIIAIVVRRLKDPAADSSLRDACRDAAGSLAEIYLRSDDSGGHGGSALSTSLKADLFLKPLLEVMGEESKTVQAGAAMCLAKVVEGGGAGGGAAFQRLCPAICKMIGAQSFLAKGSLLSVISSLAQIGAISSQRMPIVLQNVRHCLENVDWATRKAAADTLCMLASQSSHLITEGTFETIASLEACRFDKVKHVRDSMIEALQLWKELSGKGEDGTPNSLKGPTIDESGDGKENSENKNLNLNSEGLESMNDSSADSSSNDSGYISNGKLENTIDLLRLKTPSLKDKELNPEFFQKLESNNSDDLPVEIVLPHSFPQSFQSKNAERKSSNTGDPQAVSDYVVGDCGLNEYLGHFYCCYNTSERRLGARGRQQNSHFPVRDRCVELDRSRHSKLRTFDHDNGNKFSLGNSFTGGASISQNDGFVESSFMNAKENWLGIQRQLSHLERQQAHLMNMFQNFMGGSRAGLITLEDRVHGLERIVEEMAQDLLVSFGRRGGTMMMGFECSPGRSFTNCNGLQNSPSLNFGQGGDNRSPYQNNDMDSVRRVRESRRSDSESHNVYTHSAQINGNISRRRGPVSPLVGIRRSWDRSEAPFRLGEGLSASVWQASNGEATVEPIRDAREENGTSRAATR